MDKIIKVHIWQLPEKIDDIDRENDYTIINDGSTKKVSIKKLYEFFNQDYKIENIEKTITRELENLDKKFNPRYFLLELSIKKYDSMIKKLEDKFSVNKVNLRRVEGISGQLDSNIDGIINTFEIIDNKCVILLSTLENFTSVVLDIEEDVFKNSNEVNNLKINVNTLIEDTNNVEIDSQDISVRINDLKEFVDEHLQDEKETLINKINNEYDKILAIVDYYHHIHE